MDQHALAIIATALFTVSEALSLIPSVKANGVFQLVFNILAKAKDLLTGGSGAQPPQGK